MAKPAANADEDGDSEVLTEKSKHGKKKHKKQKLAGKEEDSSKDADEDGGSPDDGKAALANAKK